MSQMNGVEFDEISGCYLFHITNFSEQLKEAIRSNLSKICHGNHHVSQNQEFLNYQRTLRQFNERIESKDANTQKGMVGELLFHILTIEYLDSFEIISPFFNLEEKSIKKGFDVIVSEKETGKIWLSEAKSGNKNSTQSSQQKNNQLIHKAKSDLKERLSENNTQRWQSALSGLVFAMGTSDKITTIKKVLQGSFVEAEEGMISPASHNVMLNSNLYAPISDKIELANIQETRDSIEEENIFQSSIVITIQKETYQKVIEFLKVEAGNGQ